MSAHIVVQSGPQVLHLLRVTLEAASPLSLGSGEVRIVPRSRMQDGKEEKFQGAEMMLVRDANGLPTIPGPTLQGILRHLYQDEFGERCTHRLFGFAKDDEGESGRLFFSFGCVHDSDDRAVIGLVTDPELITGDPVLSVLHNEVPLRRDHVALNTRHVADGRRKFARRAVPIGTRFSAEIALWGPASEEEQDRQELQTLVRLLAHPACRIGGAGRRGYGKIAVVRASYQRADLDQATALRTARQEPPSKPLVNPLPRERLTAASGQAGIVIARIRLQPINPWRVGGQAPAVTPGTHGVRTANGQSPVFPARATEEEAATRRRADKDANVATILREGIIAWSDGRGAYRAVGPEGPFRFAVPASALKGPLVHRALFHWNCAQADGTGLIEAEEFTRNETALKEQLERLGTAPKELLRLFGSAKERKQTGTAEAAHLAVPEQAGRLLIDDTEVRGVRAVQAIDHNSIDRFTGGVRDGALYAEEVLIDGHFETAITILPPLPAKAEKQEEWPDPVRAALLRALADLCQGRLAVGAKSLGFCHGTIEWQGDPLPRRAWEAAWQSLLPAVRGAL